MTPAEQIRAIRAQTGLTQQAFADAYEVPRRTLQNWESGERVPPVYVLKMLEVYVNAYPPDKLQSTP